jgi:hypothetical protein
MDMNEDSPAPRNQRPDGIDDATVSALGTLSKALETVEDARGHLYAFHRLCGTADLTLGDAVHELRAAGHVAWADRIDTELVGRNIIDGRWSFQLVEDYDEHYWQAFREVEQAARQDLISGRKHVFEAEMKEERRTHGDPHHTARP